jgi:predicted Fe-Mo cluster-binding NifX family protein
VEKISRKLRTNRQGGSTMKVAVSSTGKDLTSQIDPRFGRCAFFMIVDTDDMSFEAFDNENAALGGGAGIQSASFLASKGVAAVLTGSCGPNAMKTLAAAEVPVYTDQAGTVEEAVERFRQGGLKPAMNANAAEKAGLNIPGAMDNYRPRGSGRGMGGGGRGMGGGGRGMGGGGRGMGGGGRGMGGGGRCMGGGGRGMGGGGRGMGGGSRGMGMGGKAPGSPSASSGQSLGELREQAEILQKQMEEIRAKIKNMEQGR